MKYSDGDYSVSKTTRTDINYVANHMRRSDVCEVYMSDKMLPYESLRVSVETSDEAYTIKYKTIPFAIFGIASNKMAKSVSAIWLLGTYELDKHKKKFHVITKKYLDYFHVKSKVLFNFVLASNEVSLKWLEKLGASFSVPKPYGKCGALFKYFELRSG
ncbi:MAG: hypothetical protein GY797_33385 [Deltaproteobacteria bacterium]|nr:hypothetical protein [Deltaproteobacteria bacterium]